MFESPGGRFATLRMLGLGTPRSKLADGAVPGLPDPPPERRRRSWSTPACTPRSPRSRPRTSAALVARFGSPRLEPGEDVPAQLRERGIDPKSTPARRDDPPAPRPRLGDLGVPERDLRVSEAEWEAATTDSRPDAARLPAARTTTTPSTTARSTTTATRIGSYATFGRTFDLFGDGSVRLASTPGHSAGHQSVICRLRDRDFVIGGDAIYTHGASSTTRPSRRARSTATTGAARCRSCSSSPAPTRRRSISPGHDPEHWATLGRATSRRPSEPSAAERSVGRDLAARPGRALAQRLDHARAAAAPRAPRTSP